MPPNDVALSALRGTTGRDGAVLGLPSIVDHLFDVSSLPTLPHRRRRMVRARSEAPTSHRSRAARLLAGTRRRGGRHGSLDRPGRARAPAHAPRERRRRRVADAGPRLRARGAARADPCANRADDRTADEYGHRNTRAAHGHGPGRKLGGSDKPVRRPRGLTRPPIRAVALGRSGRAGRPSTDRWRSPLAGSIPALDLARRPMSRPRSGR